MSSQIPSPLVRLARLSVSQRLIVTVVAYLTVSGLAWAASTPPGGVPDEPSHVVYAAAVARGELGEPTEVDHPIFGRLMGVDVPQWATTIVVCYAFEPSVTADCQPGISGEDQEVPATTTATKYPPPYYAAVGAPTLALDGALAFYSMRVVSVAAGVVLIGVALAVAAPARRWWLTMGVIAGFTPMAAHLLGSVNPNGVEIAAALACGVALLGMAPEDGSVRRAWFQVVAVGVLGLALAWARPWSVLILLGVVGLSLLANWVSLRDWARLNRGPTLFLVALVVVASLGALLFEFQVRDPAEAQVVSEMASFDQPLTRNVNTVLESSGSWALANVGQFGWLDHAPPSLVQFTWLGFVAAFVLWSLTVASAWRRLLVLVTLAGATLIAPLFIIEFIFGSIEGYQARYHLPVVVLIPLLAFFILGTSRSVKSMPHDSVTRGASWFAGLAPLLMLVSVIWSIARYSIGAPFGWTDLLTLRFLTDAVWLPPGEATLIAGISLVALLLLAPIIWRSVRLEQPDLSQSIPVRNKADESLSREAGD